MGYPPLAPLLISHHIRTPYSIRMSTSQHSLSPNIDADVGNGKAKVKDKSKVKGDGKVKVKKESIDEEKDKPFRCDVCPKRYARRDYLDRHLLNRM